MENLFTAFYRIRANTLSVAIDICFYTNANIGVKYFCLIAPCVPTERGELLSFYFSTHPVFRRNTALLLMTCN